jgi:transcriptional regulator with XRE-family HTH domain
MLSAVKKARADKALLRAIGGRIVELRQRRRVSQRQLAFTAGLSPSHLSLIEAGKRWPSLETLVVVAEGLDVALVDLLSLS